MTLPELIAHIDQLKSEADALRPIDPVKLSVLNQKLRLDWNYHSNAIEGNTLTLSETRMLLLHGYHTGNKLGRHYDEIKYHNDVLISLEEIVLRNDPLTEILIRELHQHMMGEEYTVKANDSLGNLINVKGNPGEYKTRQNGVRRIVNGKEIFVPFKTPDEVRTEMPELINWYRREEEKKELHPVIIAATFHYRFVTLHPFDDGNGRMSRILMNLILMRAGYVPAIIRLEQREDYINALATAQDGESLETFIEIVAKEEERSLGLLVKVAKGESIAEPDDLDKQVALLKRRLDGISEEIQIVKGKAVMDKMLIEVVVPFFRNVFAQLIKITPLFTECEFGYYIDGLGSPGSNINNLIVSMESDWKLRIGAIGEITLKIRLKNLRQLGVKAFDIYRNISLHFESHKYQIKFDQHGNESVEKLYHQLLTESEIKGLSNKFVGGIVTEIEEQVKRMTEKK